MKTMAASVLRSDDDRTTIRPAQRALAGRHFIVLSCLLHGLALLVPLAATSVAPVSGDRPLLVRLTSAPAPAAQPASAILAAAEIRPDQRSAPPKTVAKPVAARPLAVQSPASPAPLPVVEARTNPPASSAEVPRPALVKHATSSDSVPASSASASSAASAAAAGDGAALEAYVRILSGEVAKARRYPAVARLRGWQGTAVLSVELSAAGAVLASSVSRSSGHAVLDEQALRMLADSSPLPLAPVSLQGRPLVIELPVVFTLAAS